MVDKKLQLHGFNNLTKSLSFNIYDICYTRTESDQKEYIKYIDELYNAERLSQILLEVTNIIGANVLSVSRQDYDPQGSSVTMLIAEHSRPPDESDRREEPGPVPKAPAFDSEMPVPVSETILAHLDKSHVTVHTYPESHPHSGISTFRVDIDVSTCGLISPLRALNYLIHCFDSDIVTMDYRIRGFTRDVNGHKHYVDHDINSVQNYISTDTKSLYQLIDVNVYQENIFHTKMLLKEFILDNYLFGAGIDDLSEKEMVTVRECLQQEMFEIFYGRNYDLGK